LGRDNLHGDGLTSAGLHQNLHAKIKVQGALILDFVVCKCPSILKMLPSKDEPLVATNFFPGRCRSSLMAPHEGDAIASEHLHVNVSVTTNVTVTTTKTPQNVQGGELLNIIISNCVPILKLLASKGRALPVWGNVLFFLNLCSDLCSDILNSIRGLHLIDGDGFAIEGVHKDLHLNIATNMLK
jgi:hypothetical protein